MHRSAEQGSAEAAPSRGPLIVGAEAERLAPVARALSQEDPVADTRKRHGLVIAERVDLDMSYLDAVDRGNELEDVVESALPRLSQSSTAIIVVYSSRDDARLRAELREGLDSLCEQAAAVAAMRAGIDLTVNAVELPESGDGDLLNERLVEFFRKRRGVLSSGAVLPIEHLVDSSLNSELVAEFI